MNRMLELILLIIMSLAAIALIIPPPAAIQYDQKWNSQVCVKSYSEGALLINDYSSAEYLSEFTSIGANSKSGGCSLNGTAGIKAELLANVSGKLHSVSESVDAAADNKGRHTVLSRNVQDVSGIFTVDRFIQLWSNSTAGSVSLDWMPCE